MIGWRNSRLLSSLSRSTWTQGHRKTKKAPRSPTEVIFTPFYSSLKSEQPHIKISGLRPRLGLKIEIKVVWSLLGMSRSLKS